jgi:hypothetical protein
LPEDSVVKISVVGLPWYRKEDYLQLRALFVDGARLHEAYAGWLAAMIVEQPQTYRTAILATRAPLIRSFVRKFETNA